MGESVTARSSDDDLIRVEAKFDRVDEATANAKLDARSTGCCACRQSVGDNQEGLRDIKKGEANKKLVIQRKAAMKFFQGQTLESPNWIECRQCGNESPDKSRDSCCWCCCGGDNMLARLAPSASHSNEAIEVEVNEDDHCSDRHQLPYQTVCRQTRLAEADDDMLCTGSGSDQKSITRRELSNRKEKKVSGLAGNHHNQRRVRRGGLNPANTRAPRCSPCELPVCQPLDYRCLCARGRAAGPPEVVASALNQRSQHCLNGRLNSDLIGPETNAEQPQSVQEQSCATFARQLEGQQHHYESFGQRLDELTSESNNNQLDSSQLEAEKSPSKSANTEERNEELVIEFDKVLFLGAEPNFLNTTPPGEEDEEEEKGKQDFDSNLDKQQEADAGAGCPIGTQHLDWKGISDRFGKMPYRDNVSGGRGQIWRKLHHSCFCHLLTSSLGFLFPILSAFRHYSLPGDLITDLVAGFTIAVLHIPQGMAYGLLAGVDPIYGLYVSFVPVLIMALMSRSRHVSYGTFAIISMLLANATDSIKLLLKQQVLEASVAKNLADDPAGSQINPNEPLVLTNNHQQIVPPTGPQLLRNLLTPSDNPPPINLDPAENSSLPSLVGSSAGIWAPFDVATAVAAGDFVMPSNIQILTSICILVGLIQMGMALMRLGILSLMFSDQLVSSFTTASAIHVVTSQLCGLLDLNLSPVPEGLFRVTRVWWTFASQLLLEGCNTYTALLSLFSILFLLIIKELIEPALRRRFKSLTCLPSELVLMSFLIFASWNWQLSRNFNIRVIGAVPTGLPAAQVPRLDIIPAVFQDALTIALVSFAMNLSLAQVYAKRFKYSMDPNQELFALGTSNLIGSFFSCFPCASSLSRSAVQSNLNARSPLCSLFSCAIVVSIVCYFAPILHDLPRSTLSCIIIVALRGILVQIRDLHENWRLSKLDASVWMVTFASVIAFGVTYGLVLGIVASLFMVFFRLLTPNYSILGQLPGTEIYVERNAFMECHEIEQVKIFRFNSALCYLNRTMFKSSVQKSLPSVYEQKGFCSRADKHLNQADATCEMDKTKSLVIDCSALAYCDYSGAATLVELIEDLEDHKLNVYLAACPLKLITMFEKMQKLKVLEQNVFPTITDAVGHARYLRSLRSQPAGSVSLDCSTTGDESCCAPSNLDGGFKPSIS